MLGKLQKALPLCYFVSFSDDFARPDRRFIKIAPPARIPNVTTSLTKDSLLMLSGIQSFTTPIITKQMIRSIPKKETVFCVFTGDTFLKFFLF